MFKSYPRLKKIIEWLIINLAISILIFSITSTTTESFHLISFFPLLLKVNVISFACVLAGMVIRSLMKEKSMIIGIPVILCAVFCSGIAASMIFDYLLNIFFNIQIYKSISDLLIKQVTIIVIIAVVTGLSIIFDFLRFRKDELENDLRDIKDKINHSHVNDSLSIKLADGYCLIKFDDLIYLSSHGKKTTFHTKEKDYTVSYLLKNIEEKLPDNRFIRIHRQFIMNIRYLREMRYYEGGRYMVYLNDDDETMLPVGRNVAPLLKEKFAI